MQRRTSADGTNHLHARALAPGAVNVDDLVALLNRQVDGLTGQLVQGTHARQRGFMHIQTSFDQGSQFEQAHAQLIDAVIYSFDIASDNEIVQDAMRGRGMQLSTCGQGFQGDRLGLLSQGVQQTHGTVEHLNRKRRFVVRDSRQTALLPSHERTSPD